MTDGLPAEQSAKPKKSIWKRWWMIVLYVLVALIALAALIPADDDPTAIGDTTTTASGETTTTATGTETTTTEGPETTTTEVPETTTTEVPETTTTTVPVRPPVFGNGTHEVGVDITAGIYETGLLADSIFGCYWARLAGFSGQLDDIIANDNAVGHSIVEIADSDAAFENSCGDWYTMEVLDELLDVIPEGRWAVGVHIPAGQYEAPGGDVCYWERLSGFSGELDDVIANDLPTGRAIVEIASSDTGFSSNGCGEWTLR